MTVKGEAVIVLPYFQIVPSFSEQVAFFMPTEAARVMEMWGADMVAWSDLGDQGGDGSLRAGGWGPGFCADPSFCLPPCTWTHSMCVIGAQGRNFGISISLGCLHIRKP